MTETKKEVRDFESNGNKEALKVISIIIFFGFFLLLVALLLSISAHATTKGTTIQEDTVPIYGFNEVLLDNQSITDPTQQIHLSDFKKEVKYLTDTLDCKWITVNDLVANYVDKGIKTPRNSCVMTFDGGLSSQYKNALPVLKQYGVASTFYIITNRVGRNGYMNWTQIENLQAMGNEIGDFTKNHLKMVSDNLTTQQLKDEIVGAKNILEAHNLKVTTFAYPYGESNNEIINILKSNGFIAARDIQKANTWRRKVPVLTSPISNSFLWHLNYYKPEQATLSQIKNDTFYNGWWQFEEEYKPENYTNGSIFLMSAARPTNTSYAIIDLENKGNAIVSNFLVPSNGKYQITIYGYTGYKTPDSPYQRLNRTNVYVDGKLLPKSIGNSTLCNTVWNWQFCPYYVTTNLSSGKHTLEVQANKTRIRVDKFRVNLLSSSNSSSSSTSPPPVVINDSNQTTTTNQTTTINQTSTNQTSNQTVTNQTSINQSSYGSLNYTLIPVQEDKVPIYGYHYVINDSIPITEPTLQIHKSKFESQVQYLTDVVGCKWITLGNLTKNYIDKGLKTPKNSCVMTFDDGYANNYYNVLPILEKYHAVATFYIITGYVGDQNFMTWNDIRQLYNHGNEIGDHTETHPHLTLLNYSQIVTEINGSKKILESHGYNPITFAYPYGNWNNQVIDVLKKTGFIAGRDISNPNLWRMDDPVSVSPNGINSFIWHMYYYKPENSTNAQLKSNLFYNGWWQFEEEYKVNHDPNNNINIITYFQPTNTSYGILELPDTGDKITSDFMVYKSGLYRVTIYGYTGETYDTGYYQRLNRTNVYIDGNKVQLHPGNSSQCALMWTSYMCPYYADVNLTGYKHSLSVESAQGRIRIDKFRVSQMVHS